MATRAGRRPPLATGLLGVGKGKTSLPTFDARWQKTARYSHAHGEHLQWLLCRSRARAALPQRPLPVPVRLSPRACERSVRQASRAACTEVCARSEFASLAVLRESESVLENTSLTRGASRGRRILHRGAAKPPMCSQAKDEREFRPNPKSELVPSGNLNGWPCAVAILPGTCHNEHR
jgi:hypothetical protein